MLPLYEIGSPKNKIKRCCGRHDELKKELRNGALKNELASKSIEILGVNVAILNEDVEKWNDNVNGMRQDYNETIHSLMPETIDKKWVVILRKNVSLYGGNAFLCLLLVPLFISLFLLTHQAATRNGILVKIK